ncbi:MAG: J domain-containing protein [Deltaproteobacteria bacterium]|nr:J domain-containing protein [Deltaproteobacteria bacterium]
MAQEDYYQVLGVDQNATGQQIKETFRKLAFKYHPDRNKENPVAAEQMKKVNEAYAVLSNPAKKSEYDTLKNQFGSSAYTHFRNNYSDSGGPTKFSRNFTARVTSSLNSKIPGDLPGAMCLGIRQRRRGKDGHRFQLAGI